LNVTAAFMICYVVPPFSAQLRHCQSWILFDHRRYSAAPNKQSFSVPAVRYWPPEERPNDATAWGTWLP